MVQEQRKHQVLHEQHILPTDILIHIIYTIGKHCLKRLHMFITKESNTISYSLLACVPGVQFV
jgi:hypothetical protein